MSLAIIAFTDLVTYFYEVIFSVFNTAFNTVYGLLSALTNLFSGILMTTLHLGMDTLETASGLWGFISSELSIV
jgi:hypothetical protein